MRVRVCRLEELTDPGATEFSAPGAVRTDDYFVVRRGDALACFSNFCPHMGNALNWAPNRFLSRDGSLILCPAHGAIYDPTSGECRGGPCNGRALTRWPVAVCDGLIMADVPPPPTTDPMAEDPLARLERYHPPSADDGVNPPITDSSTFVFRDPEKLKAMFGEDPPGCTLYARSGSATIGALAGALAALEDTETARVFASGMAAVVATLMQLTGAGGEIVADRTIYGGTYSLLANFLPRFDIETRFVDIRDLAAVESAIDETTTAIYCETLSNPLLRVANLPALAAIARDAGVPLVVDNTFAPLLVSPAALGADIVLHSLTKFINGAGDGLGGVVCARREFVAALGDVGAGTAMLLGASLDPLRAQSIYKNLGTLGVRMIRHGDNALYLAKRLENAGLRVSYPGLAGHPEHELLASMMNPGYGYGGMLTLDAGTADAADELAVRLQDTGVGHLAVSLGHHQTLFSPSAGSTSSELAPELRTAAGLSPGLLRFSIGLDADVEATWERFAGCLEQTGLIA